jgi:ATP-dependent DNA ligase
MRLPVYGPSPPALGPSYCRMSEIEISPRGPIFPPCHAACSNRIPTRATKVPAGPDWIHEIKHDGYRLLVQREGKRVRLFTRNGRD